MFPRNLKPGQKLTASEQAELLRRVHQLDYGAGAGNASLVRENGAFIVRDTSRDTIFAQITGAPTGANYPYTEVAQNGSGSYVQLAVPPGRSGTATYTPAVELTGRTDVPVNTVVELTVLPGGNGWGFTYGKTTVPPPTTLKTQNTDATQAITSTTEVDSDKTSGIGFTASGSKNTLACIPATGTQQGVVTTTNQVVVGLKTSTVATDTNPGGWWVYMPQSGTNLVQYPYYATYTPVSPITVPGVIGAVFTPTTSLASPAVTTQCVPTFLGNGSGVSISKFGHFSCIANNASSPVISTMVWAAGDFLNSIASGTPSAEGLGVFRDVGGVATLQPGIDGTLSVCKTATVAGGIVTGQSTPGTLTTLSGSEMIPVCSGGTQYMISASNLKAYLNSVG